ncbi:hypothetical protein Trydic_g7065 [Trypoxylus dichotomus]
MIHFKIAAGLTQTHLAKIDFSKKTLPSENPALKTAITQKIWEATKGQEEVQSEDFNHPIRYQEAPSKFQIGRHWKKMDRRGVQTTNEKDFDKL